MKLILNPVRDFPCKIVLVLFVVLILSPTLVLGQVLVWNFDHSTVDISVSTVRIDGDVTTCEDSTSDGADPAIPGQTYEATAECPGAEAEAAVVASTLGEFDCSALVSATATVPDVSGAIARMESSFAFEVSGDTDILVQFHVQTSDSADRSLRFALEGPSSTVAEVVLNPLAWDEVDEDVVLAGHLVSGQEYRLELSFLYDAWDQNFASLTIDDFRYDGVIPVRTKSWGMVKRAFTR